MSASSGTPDFFVARITFTPASPRVNEVVAIGIVIGNEGFGTGDCTSVAQLWYSFDGGGFTQTGVPPAPEPGSESTYPVPGNPYFTTTGLHTVTAHVNQNGQCGEVDLDDNLLTATVNVRAAFVDGDGDTVADDEDNCPSRANPGQADADADGFGDECDVPFAATLYGGSGVDEVYDVAVDGAGNIVITGKTESNDFAGPPQRPTPDGRHAFVAKFSPDLATRLWVTYLGGASVANYAQGNALAVDAGGDVYVTGVHRNPDFPTVNAAQPFAGNAGWEEGFLARLDGDTGIIVYSTHIGGASNDAGLALAVASDGTAFVAGMTNSPDFPTTTGAHDRTFGGPQDAFFAQYSPTGTLLLASYLGGSQSEASGPLDIALGQDGSFVIASDTSSPDFPSTPSPYDGSYNANGDGFLAKFTPSGVLQYATLFGGNGNDHPYGVSVLPDGNIDVVGFTSSTDAFPLTGDAYDNAYAGAATYQAGFLTRYSPTLGVVYGTIFEGAGHVHLTDLVHDAKGIVHVAGMVEASDLAHPGTVNGFGGFRDAFVMHVDPRLANAAGLLRAGYLGGDGYDDVRAIALAPGADVLAGSTNGGSLVGTTGVFQPSPAGSMDGIVFVGDAAPPPPPTPWVVTDAADVGDEMPGDGLCAATATGTCTLRAAIEEANARPGLDAITFAFALAISPATPLPAIASPLHIDGTVGGFYPLARVVLDGTSTPDAATDHGLVLTGAAEGSTIRGLTVRDFSSQGIWVQANQADVLENHVLDNAGSGVHASSASDVYVYGNVVAGNDDRGILVEGQAARPVIAGNHVGLGPDGAARPNGVHGIELRGLEALPSHGPTHGLVTANLVANNLLDGIHLEDVGTAFTLVEDNVVGLLLSAPTRAAPNGASGIVLQHGTSDNVIRDNVVSGNGLHGVMLEHAATQRNLLHGNLFGTDAAGGGAAFADHWYSFNQGIRDWSGARPGRIHGDLPQAPARIASPYDFSLRFNGIAKEGVELFDDFNPQAFTAEFWVKPDAVQQPNADILDNGHAQFNSWVVQYGSRGPGASEATYLFAIGHGTEFDRITFPLADNQWQHVAVVKEGPFAEVYVNGQAVGQKYGGYAGLPVFYSGEEQLTVGNHAIRLTTPAYDRPFAGLIDELGLYKRVLSPAEIQSIHGGRIDKGFLHQNQDGILVDGASGTVIGGSGPGEGNVISGNRGHGIRVTGLATGTVVEGNRVGTDASGTVGRPNRNNGIEIIQAGTTTVGGAASGEGNLISGNAGEGLHVIDSGAATIAGNVIGLDAAMTARLPNDQGVGIERSPGTKLGLPVAGGGNVIAGNANFGVVLGGQETRDITIQGNLIGTNAAGAPGLGNGWLHEREGILLHNAHNVLVGGTSQAARNVIAGNGGYGILLTEGVHEVDIVGNLIGVVPINGGLAPRGNRDGIGSWGAHGVRIGDGTAAGRNVISAQRWSGIYLDPDPAGRNPAAFTPIVIDDNELTGNGCNGVDLWSDMGSTAQANQGWQADWAHPEVLIRRNVISGNGANQAECGTNGPSYEDWDHGVRIEGPAFDAVTVQDNWIGVDRSGGAMPNAGVGVRVASTAPSQGLPPAEPTDHATGIRVLGNRIADNGRLGIDLGALGVTPNDLADADGGPNGLQNAPVIASWQAGATQVSGSIDHAVQGSLTIDVYRSGVCDPSGHGEGAVHLGSAEAVASGTGPWSFSLPVAALDADDVLTATATGLLGTSEFSRCRGVLVPPMALADTYRYIGGQALTQASGLDYVQAPLQQPFEDIGAGGIRVLDDVDDASIPVAIGFPFPFYGTQHTQVHVSSNGVVTFGQGTGSYSEVPLDSTYALPMPTIAALWDDWVTSGPGYVTTQILGAAPERRMVIQWHEVQHFPSSPSAATFQVALFESGRIDIRYLDLDTADGNVNGLSASVGIRDDESGGRALALAYHESLAGVPGFTILPRLSVLDNDHGDPDQTLTAVLVQGTSHGSLTLAPDGTFTYTPEPGYFGDDSFTYLVSDGVRASAAATVSLVAHLANQPPSFTPGLHLTLLEDSPPQTVVGWATAIRPGPPHEAGQVVTFSSSLPTIGPLAYHHVAPNGTLQVGLRTNHFGTASVTVVAQDDGLTAGGGRDTSSPHTHVVNVLPVNDPPSFMPGPHISVAPGTFHGVYEAWAQDISPGPTGESEQEVTFLVNLLFPEEDAPLFANDGRPRVAPDGTLTFSLEPGEFGGAWVSVQARDDGGTDHGGEDTSPAHLLLISVVGPPVLQEAIQTADGMLVRGTLQGAPFEAYNIDLVGQAEGCEGQGVRFGGFGVFTDGAGLAAFEDLVPTAMPFATVHATASLAGSPPSAPSACRSVLSDLRRLVVIPDAAPSGSPANLFAMVPSVTSGTAFTVMARVERSQDSTLDGRERVVYIELERGSGPSGATLAGTTAVVTQDGIATFDDLVLDRVTAGQDQYRFRLSSFGVADVVTGPVQVTTGAPVAARFVSVPSDVTSGQPFDVVGQVVDAGGNPVSTTGTLTLVLSPADGEQTLAITSIDGTQALFAGLVLSGEGPRQLRLSWDGPDSRADNAVVDVQPHVASVAVLAPGQADADQAIPVRVELRDAGGDPQTGASHRVRLELVSGRPSGSFSYGGLEDDAVDGVALFAPFVFDPGQYTLRASVEGLAPVTHAITVRPGLPALLDFVQHPTPTFILEDTGAFSVGVRALDGVGNPTPRSPPVVTLGLDDGSALQGVASGALGDETGERTFSNLRVPIAGSYRVVARAPGLGAAVSDTLIVNPPGVEDIASLTLTPSSAFLTAGQRQTFTAVARDRDGDGIDLFFDYEVEGGIGLDQDGGSVQAQAFTPGRSSLTVRAGTFEARATIVVEAGPLAQLRIDPEVASSDGVGPLSFRAAGEDAFGNPRLIGDVTWTHVAPDGSRATSPARDDALPFTLAGPLQEGVHVVEALANGFRGTSRVFVTTRDVRDGETQTIVAATAAVEVDGEVAGSLYAVGVREAEEGATIVIQPPAGDSGAASLLGRADVTLERPAEELALALETRLASDGNVPPGLDAADLAEELDRLGGCEAAMFLRVSATERGQPLDSTALNGLLGTLVVQVEVPASYFASGCGDTSRVRLIEYSDGERSANVIFAPFVRTAGDVLVFEATLQDFSTFAIVGASISSAVSSAGGGAPAGGGGGGGGGLTLPVAGPIQLPTGDVSVPRIELQLKDGVNRAQVVRGQVYTPLPGPPPAAPPLPRAVTATKYMQVEVQGEGGDVEEVAFQVSLAPADVPDPARAVLLHLRDGAWHPESGLVLTLENGRYVGRAASSCCSAFAIAFDLEAPTLTAQVPAGTVSGIVRIPFVAQDNLGVAVVRLVDGAGAVLAQDDEAPFQLQLDTANVPEGPLQVRIEALDFTGQSASVEGAFTVRHVLFEPGEGVAALTTTGAGTRWPLLLALGFVALAIPAAVLFGRRNRGAKAEAPVEVPQEVAADQAVLENVPPPSEPDAVLLPPGAPTDEELAAERRRVERRLKRATASSRTAKSPTKQARTSKSAKRRKQASMTSKKRKPRKS